LTSDIREDSGKLKPQELRHNKKIPYLSNISQYLMREDEILKVLKDWSRDTTRDG
jgi:hypothetical protein